MKNMLIRTATLTFAALAAMMPSPAQTAAPQQNAAPGRGTGGGRKENLDLASAKKMAVAVETAAGAAGEHVAICIMDSNGEVVLTERMDHLNDRIPLATAQGKARAVLLLGVSTGQMADAMRDHKPIAATLTPPPIAAGGGEITLMRGGLPIMKEGKMIGAIAVGGSSSESDEKYAQMGIDALQTK
jgi:uncharacterized protein GlcG (DUF336 family)